MHMRVHMYVGMYIGMRMWRWTGCHVDTRLSSSEMALFQLLGTAKAVHFKAISKLVREPRPEPPLAML